MSFNDNIIYIFEKLLVLLKKLDKVIDDEDKNIYRIRHLTNSLDIIKQLDYKLTHKTIDNFSKIPGIGKGTINRVIEIIDTNSLQELTELDNKLKIMAKKSDIVSELSSIINIGDKKALKLIKEHNITSINDLKNKVKNGTIKLNDKIMLGLKYHDKYKRDIPREEMNSILSYLDEIIQKISKKLIFVLCGSYRRGLATSGDIDVLLVHTDVIYQKEVYKATYLTEVVEALHKNNFIVEDLTTTDKTKYMGFAKYKNNPIRRIDIRMVGMISFFPALLYFTGSYEFNQNIRKIAKKQGYKLNEYGLYDKNNNMIVLHNEKELFDILKIKYIEPHNR